MIEQNPAPTASTIATASKTNRLAIVSALLAALTVVGTVVIGAVAIAVFAVGAGHVALQQIANRGERGKMLAVASLLVGYGVGVYALLSAIVFWIAFALPGQ